MHRFTRPPTGLLVVFATVALVAGACGAASGPQPSPTGPGPSPTTRPTPTPIGVAVQTPADAAALVIATNRAFAGAIEQTPDIIGASKWWTATPLPGGGFRIELTVGWGDCPAGCIERHTWTFDVSPDGKVELVAEAGDAVPADLRN